MVNKQALRKAWNNLKKNHAITLRKGDDAVVLGCNEEIKYIMGPKLLKFMEDGYEEVA